MRKIIIAFALMVISVTTVNAQLRFGIKGGLNVTKMSFTSDALSRSNRCGFFVGPTVKFTLPVVGLGMDISAFYNQRTSYLDADEDMKSYAKEQTGYTVEGENVTHKSISVPLNVRYQFLGLGDNASFFVYTGPQVDFTLGSKNIYREIEGWTFRSSNFSWNLGLGAVIADHIQVTANYNIGLSKTGDIASDIPDTVRELLGINKAYENTWQIGVAYLF